MTAFSTTVTKRDEVTEIAIVGEVDAYSAPMLREQFVELSQAGEHQLVVDMAGLEFIDSVGIGVLVQALKRARSEGGDVVLRAVPEGTVQVLQLTGLDRVFEFID